MAVCDPRFPMSETVDNKTNDKNGDEGDKVVEEFIFSKLIEIMEEQNLTILDSVDFNKL